MGWRGVRRVASTALGMAAWLRDLEGGDAVDRLSPRPASPRAAAATLWRGTSEKTSKEAQTERQRDCALTPVSPTIATCRPAFARRRVRCNNWLEAEEGDGYGHSTGAGASKPLGAWCTAKPQHRPIQEDFDTACVPGSPPPATRQRSPAVSEVDEPLMSLEEHLGGNGGHQMWCPALSRGISASNAAANDRNWGGLSGGHAVVRPLGERFIVQREGKWYETSHASQQRRTNTLCVSAVSLS